MKLERAYIDAEFDRFFEFPTDDRSQVSSVSCKLFALQIAQPLLEEIARLQSAPAEQCTVPEAIEPVAAGLALMVAEPKRFKAFDAPNGWGLYRHFLPWIAEYLEACRRYPGANVMVSR